MYALTIVSMEQQDKKIGKYPEKLLGHGGAIGQ
jgi:hypothetical protein